MTGADALERGYARWFNQHGWAVDDIDYRPGIDSVVDVVATYDRLRAQHPHAPICADGSSAGGHLVMLLAASRPSLNCAISEAGIVDLRNVVPWLREAVQAYVFPNLWEFSPLRVARYIAQPLLCAGSSADPVVPEFEQLAEIKYVRPQTQTMLLAGVATPSGQWPNFTHASVTPEALSSFRRAVLLLLRQAAKH